MSATDLKKILAAAVIGGALSGCGEEVDPARTATSSYIGGPVTANKYMATQVSEYTSKSQKDVVCYVANTGDATSGISCVKAEKLAP